MQRFVLPVGGGGGGGGGMARGDGSGRWGEDFMFFLNRRKRNLNAQQLILYSLLPAYL
ncbi:MAG: hypothetical protein F6K58_31485 [Symploca sp. SIO2E9]|nr:hypothetical protein [Symploca sp. SIO2E9]